MKQIDWLIVNGAGLAREAAGELRDYRKQDEQGRLVKVIKCKDCTEYDPSSFRKGFGWCNEFDRVTIDEDYCSNAEAKLAELKGTEE